MTRGQALSAVVLIHLAISIVHGQAHTGAQVPLSGAATFFVYTVILAGPLLGLAVFRWRPRAGAAIVAVSMAGALIFGLINHFILDGSDHVGHVAAAWRTQFGVTAALLAISEAAGLLIGVSCLTKNSDIEVGEQSPTLWSEKKV
jgi:glucan phosphoethanolaminetransferase (alkaline phosphatase superfamily)